MTEYHVFIHRPTPEHWVAALDQLLPGGIQVRGIGVEPLEALAALVTAWATYVRRQQGITSPGDALNEAGREIAEKSLEKEPEKLTPELEKLQSEGKLFRMDLKSTCHQKPVKVVGGVTKHYECTECEMPCDVIGEE